MLCPNQCSLVECGKPAANAGYHPHGILVVDLPEHAVGQPNAVDIPQTLWGECLFRVRKILIKGLQKPPVKPDPGLRPGAICPEQDAVGVLEEETASRVGLPTQLSDPAGGFHVEIRIAIKPAADRGQVFRVVGEMGANKSRLRVAGNDPVAGLQERLPGGKPLGRKTPFRVPEEFLPSLVGFVDGKEESSRVGGVDNYRKPQLSTCLPDRIPSRIIDGDQRTVRILVAESKLLEITYV